MSKHENPWKTLNVRDIYENPWISVAEHKVTNPAGNPGIYGKVSFKNLACGIIPRDDDGNTSKKLYYIMGLPTSVFVTAEGEIAHTQIGQMSDEQNETFSQRLVAGETISP